MHKFTEYQNSKKSLTVEPLFKKTKEKAHHITFFS